MRNFLAILLALLLVASAAPIDAASPHERNLAFLWSLVGDHDAATPTTMPDGRVIALEEALAEAAARAGSVDLASLMTGAGEPSLEVEAYVGDIWIIDIGPGSCTTTMIAPGSPVFVPVDPQLWIYQGGIGTMEAHGDIVYVYAWTVKMTASFDNTGWYLYANQDFYCFSFSGYHFAFPFANGYVEIDAEA